MPDPNPASKTAGFKAYLWKERAREYFDAGLGSFGNPKNYLIMHSVELLAKAIIIEKDGNLPPELEKSHDLYALFAAAGIDPTKYPVMVGLDPKTTYFRYPKERQLGGDPKTAVEEAIRFWEKHG